MTSGPFALPDQCAVFSRIEQIKGTHKTERIQGQNEIEAFPRPRIRETLSDKKAFAPLLLLPVTVAHPPAAPDAGQATVRAFGLKDGNGQRALLMAVREKEQTFEGQLIRVLCPADGSGEIIAAVNGAARGWAKMRAFWVVQGQQLMLISDSGYPNDVPQRFEVLEKHVDDIIKTGVEMCPLGGPAARAAVKSITSAVQNYEANARSLGVALP